MKQRRASKAQEENQDHVVGFSLGRRSLWITQSIKLRSSPDVSLQLGTMARGNLSKIMDLAITFFPLVVILQANRTHTLRANILAGICFHPLVARPEVEFEKLMRHFLSIAVIFSGIDLFASIYLVDRSLPASILQSCVSWSGFVVGLLASLSIYRFFFHRCRDFPGPVGARLSRFYTSYLNAQEGQFYRKLAAIHEKYGDYVRMGECVMICHIRILAKAIRATRTQRT
jgi:hypothetical protein